MTRISASQQLSDLIANISIEELRAQWKAIAQTSSQRASPIRCRARADDIGALQAQDFLVLLNRFVASRAPHDAQEEMEWAAAALDMFGQMDLRGDGALTWDDFATFVMDLDVSLAAPSGDAETVEESDNGTEPLQSAVHRIRRYQPVDDGIMNEDCPHGLRKLEYMPFPIHRVLAIPRGVNGSELVHIITPDMPPRICATLRHHSAYRAHNVLTATSIPCTKNVVTASSVRMDAHYLTLWSLPTGCTLQIGPRTSIDGKYTRREGTLLPVLVHRTETPSPQSTVFASREGILFSGGEVSGLVFEWELVGFERHGEPTALRQIRASRLHTFGITSIIEVERRDDAKNLLVTGSADGYISVWNSNDRIHQMEPAPNADIDLQQPQATSRGQHQQQSAVAAEKSTVTQGCSSGSFGIKSRKELEPLIQLSAHATGPGKLVFSHDHGLLFSTGRLNSKDASMGPTSVLVWKFMESLAAGFRRQIHKSLHRHQAHIADMVEVRMESHLVTADVSGHVVVWNLPNLDIHQQFVTSSTPNICCAHFPVVTLAADAPAASRAGRSLIILTNVGVDSDGVVVNPPATLMVSTDCIKAYPCKLNVIKEPLILAHYDPHMCVFVVVSTQRVCVWNAKNGRLKSQVEAALLLGGDDAEFAAAQATATDSDCRIKKASETLEDRDTSPPEIVAACVSATGRKLVVGDDRGGLHVCMLPPGDHRPFRTKALDPHEGSSTTLSFLDSCGAVLSAGSDGIIGIHDEAEPSGYEAGDPTNGILARSVRVRDVRLFSSVLPSSFSFEQFSLNNTFAPGRNRLSTLAGDQRRRVHHTGSFRGQATHTDGQSSEHNENAAKRYSSSFGVLPTFKGRALLPRANSPEAHPQWHRAQGRGASVRRNSESGQHSIDSSTHDSENAADETSGLTTQESSSTYSSDAEGDGVGDDSAWAATTEADDSPPSAKRPSMAQSDTLGANLVNHEVLYATADLHLNLVASLSRGGATNVSSAQVCIWDFELFNLIGTCASPLDRGVIPRNNAGLRLLQRSDKMWRGRTSEPSNRFERITGLVFLSPYPLLAGCTSQCTVHLWKVPSCTITYTLELSSPLAGFFVTAPPKEDETESCSSAKDPMKQAGFAIVKASLHAHRLTPKSAEHDPNSNSSNNNNNNNNARTFHAVVSGGTDDGHILFWGLHEDFFSALECSQVKPSRRLTYNPLRHVHVQMDWADQKKSRRNSQVFVNGGRFNVQTTPGGSKKATCRTWVAHDDGAEVTHLQIIRQQQIIVSASEDGLARLWSWDGALVGQLDVNMPLGAPRCFLNSGEQLTTAWKFHPTPVVLTLKDISDPDGPDIASILTAAKEAAANPTLRENDDDRGCTDPPETPANESRQVAQLSTSPWCPRMECADDARGGGENQRSWDTVFDCLVNLERKKALLVKDAPRRDSSMITHKSLPLKGKHWRTRERNPVPFSRLTPELSDLGLSHSQSQPTLSTSGRRVCISRSVRDVAKRRAVPVPRAGPYERKTPFPDNDARPLARITQLTHMGLL